MKEISQTPTLGSLTLDPDSWEDFATLSHRMVDSMIEHLRSLGAGSAWTESPDSIRRLIVQEPLPMLGQGEEAVFEQFLSDVLPFGTSNSDPRFYGWVQGNGTVLGMMADMLASGMNPHLAGFNQNPVAVEQKVIDWLRELMGFPVGSSGILLSGGSMANVTALIVARNTKAGFDVRQEGLQGGDRPLLTVYGTSETHSWAKKGVEALGLGDRSFRRVATHPDFTMDIDALREAVAIDRANGCLPIAVIATAGTVNTGATDDLNALADYCCHESIWLHVDGAFGALAALSPRQKHLVKGLDRADSVAFDLHKWMYLPFEIACLIVRDGSAHRNSFSVDASYIAPLERGVIKGGQTFAELGLELTRGFKALKAWMSLKAYGVEKFAALIEQNVDQAQYFAERVRNEPDLELMAPVPLNVVCFRFVSSGMDTDGFNRVNKELLFRIQERGIAVPSSTVLGGAFCLRVCLVNHRTRQEDLDDLVEAAVRIGNEILVER